MKMEKKLTTKAYYIALPVPGPLFEPCCEKTGLSATRSDTNWAVQPHKMARGLKIWIEEVEGLYYPCSENKGADQLCGYHEADLRLCFRL